MSARPAAARLGARLQPGPACSVCVRLAARSSLLQSLRAAPGGLAGGQVARRQQQRVAAPPPAAAAAAQPPPQPADVSEVARQNLKKAAVACRRYGWISFWVQLVLNTVAAVVLLFSLAFTSQNGPGVSLYLTLFGIVLGFLSMFWSFGYVRLSRKLRAFLDAPAAALDAAPKVRRSDVIAMLEKGAVINVLGAGATMLGLSATIGVLLAKTLTSATVNPFLATSSSNWNPVLAFDVFNVQATTNALLSHLFSLVCSLWLLRVIANRPSAGHMLAGGSTNQIIAASAGAPRPAAV
ncbi:TIC chloroplastic-like [Micractinium conductrix]|uniref:TIC chloroplastic-like n=1 Tax=Micractinium conductrix TaxID=554055 RepID=A0A2P6V3I4_9CHLO|nr:TIC chloroplastic-like [Micractinium conductrix]|eukprot:PSC68634.1 TIC chloroplastic-like [Micractinium conductrix]